MPPAFVVRNTSPERRHPPRRAFRAQLFYGEWSSKKCVNQYSQSRYSASLLCLLATLCVARDATSNQLERLSKNQSTSLQLSSVDFFGAFAIALCEPRRDQSQFVK